MPSSLPVLMPYLALSVALMSAAGAAAEPLHLRLRDQTSTVGDVAFRPRVRDEKWDPKSTAVIICDVWDYHHCRNAVDRLEEFGPRLNQVVKRARELGATIIHAPSDCMPAYVDHPARTRALATPRAPNLPKDVDQWCSLIPAERTADYPVDQSDGGEDDEPAAHAAWAAKLKSLGRNPAMPWQRQSDMIEIDAALDFISDRGDEVWSILEARGIRHVILAGVHTNMCVLGRPFGLRRMVLGGKQVVLLRDMTDTMYDPTSWPYVNHFTANDLIIDHVERYVCPTITSDQLLGGRPFRFAADKRPHLVIVAAEDGYGTKETLPRFAAEQLGRDFRVSYVFGRMGESLELPGLEALDDADLALFSVRRHVLKPEAMAIVRRFVQAGKPILGIRTASHAFALKTPPPAGYEAWPEFDVDVFGARYIAHSTSQSDAAVSPSARADDDPLLSGLRRETQILAGGLYQFSELSPRVKPLLEGEQDGGRQPIAWTFARADGGRSFYASLGERRDFASSEFVRLLRNAVYWSAGLPVPSQFSTPTLRASLERHWSNVVVPGPLAEATEQALHDYDGAAWFRSVVRIPVDWRDVKLTLRLPKQSGTTHVWWNGQALPSATEGDKSVVSYPVASAAVTAGDANLLVIRRTGSRQLGFADSPSLSARGPSSEISLQGRWQFRIGDDPAFSSMPLPAKFGASTDIVIDPVLKDPAR